MEPLSQAQTVRRIVDRLAFGLPTDERRALCRLSPVRATQALLQRAGEPPRPPSFTPVPEATKRATAEQKKARRQVLAANARLLTRWWLTELVTSESPTRERLTWFWHGHFATSMRKVRPAQLMLTQNQVFRRLGAADFGALAQAMILDPALMVWLDAAKNRAGSPNENLAREYLELFTLGHDNYTEADVTDAARALTGWVLRRDGSSTRAQLVPRRHDAGAKTILGSTGDFGALDVTALALGQQASARFVIGRLWARFVSHQPPSEAQLARLIAAYGPERRIADVLTAMVTSADFRSPEAALVKEPVLWLTGLARQLGLTSARLAEPLGIGKRVTLADAMLAGLDAMGQAPLRPPSVGGWPAARGWLSSGTAAARLVLANRVVAAAPPRLTGSAASRLAAAAELLGVDGWSRRTSDALVGVADRPAQLVALAACAPEYIVSR